MVAFVFVYGTLMRSGANHPVLLRLGAVFVGEAETVEPRMLVDLGPYPALLPIGSQVELRCTVHGELYEIPDASLAALDAFEGTPHLYARERLRLRSPAGERDAFAYVLARRPPRTAEVIASGRYSVAGTALPDGAKLEQVEVEPGG